MTLAELVRDRNSDRTSDAIMKVIYGAGATVITCGALFAVCWFVGLAATASSKRAAIYAFLITSGAFGLAFWAAWSKVDPLRELLPREAAGKERATIDALFPGQVAEFQNLLGREKVGGFMAIVFAGPLNFVEALAAWKDRIPEEGGLVERAGELLARFAESGLPSATEVDPEAFLLLARLGLLKAKKFAEDEVVLSLNAKGKQVVAESG
ncbi:MAG TPA: hypothetical protein VFF73_03095 [Planctomycetota bacterium]|nr:hypothetical protein [Planctomycetota bacterium]